MKKKMTKDVARIENKFALEAHYKLSLIQQKVFYALVSRLNPKEEDEFEEQILTITELKKILGSEGKAYKSLYSRLDDFIDKTSRVIFRFPTDVVIDGEVLRGAMPFFQHIIPRHTKHGEAAIGFQFNKKLRPFLLKLNEYVQINQLQVAKMKSAYAIRIYTMLKAIRAKRGQHEKTSSETYGVEQIKGFLGIGQKEYKRFFDFERRVLKQAQKEINENTDIRILEIEKVKARRTVTDLIFHFTEQKTPDKRQLKLDVEEPKPKKKEREAPKQSKKDNSEVETLLTKAQKIGFDSLCEIGVNTTFIIENILPSVRGLGTEVAGYEDFYVQTLLSEFKRKSREAGKPHQAGVFVNWWKRFLNDDEQKSRFREMLIERKRTIKDNERSARRRADTMTFYEYEGLKKKEQQEKESQSKSPQFVSRKINQTTVEELIQHAQRETKAPFVFENAKAQFPEKYTEIAEKTEKEFWQQAEAIPNFKIEKKQAERDIQNRTKIYFEKWYKNQ